MEGRAVALLATLAFALAGCGADETSRGDPAEPGYGGELYLSRAAAEHPRAGAAGDVVDCVHWGSGGFSDAKVYAEGATASSPERALDVARGEGGFEGAQQGLRLAREDEDRVLYVLTVAGIVKQAVIVRDGPATEGAGGAGWYVESWARCDYSELPRSFTDGIGLQVWTDTAGRPVPTTRIESWTGSEHCDWQSMTFLFVNGAVYVRDPQPELADYFADAFAEHAELPHERIDTGFERDGDHLWLSNDKQRAFVGDGDEGDVEVWPRTIKQLGCA